MKETLKIEPNMIFGHLKVIEKDLAPKKDAHVYWICECGCEKKTRFSVRSTSLRKGQVTSCGCEKGYIRTENSAKGIDLTNKYFGFLKVLYPSEKRSGSHIMWHCKCRCGTELDIDGHSLRAGLSQSCGCMKQSKGEQKIEQLLLENCIPYEKEKTFNNCTYKTGFKPRFDFYVDNHYLIEYDGIQHFEEDNHYFNGFERDLFKNTWCKEHHIPLIRIPYTHYNNLCIQDLKLNTSKFLVNKEKKSIMLKENSRKVFDYVKSMQGQNITAQDIADATGLTTKQVNGSVTSAFQRKGLMVRTPAKVETEDGVKEVKFISLTDEGMAFDPDATEEKAN